MIRWRRIGRFGILKRLGWGWLKRRGCWRVRWCWLSRLSSPVPVNLCWHKWITTVLDYYHYYENCAWLLCSLEMVSRNRRNTNLEKCPVSSQSKTDNEVDDHDTTLNIPWSSFFFDILRAGFLMNCLQTSSPSIMSWVLAWDVIMENFENHVNNAIDKESMATKNIPWQLTIRRRVPIIYLARRIFRIRVFF